jgi:hypothetical protein
MYGGDRKSRSHAVTVKLKRPRPHEDAILPLVEARRAAVRRAREGDRKSKSPDGTSIAPPALFCTPSGCAARTKCADQPGEAVLAGMGCRLGRSHGFPRWGARGGVPGRGAGAGGRSRVARGRRPIYCSAACRQAAWRHRAAKPNYHALKALEGDLSQIRLRAAVQRLLRQSLVNPRLRSGKNA